MRDVCPNLPATALVIVLTLTFAGLAEAKDPPRLYYWTTYEQEMYLAYDQPDDEDRQMKLAATLLRIIQKSDEAGRKPAPGVVAEYGYFLLQRGEYYSAIDHFRREAATWPESKTLMERMIRIAQAEAGL
ncbi:MAG: DUF4810 domain-containing protein [Gammaproteobacteria bacterium]|nr:DUF4810 domain-containing protein [Gammaproteobacteria bacterium]